MDTSWIMVRVAGVEGERGLPDAVEHAVLPAAPHIVGVLFSECAVVIQHRLVGAYTRFPSKRGCNCDDKDRAIIPMARPAILQAMQLPCFAHSNYPLELNLRRGLDRFLELEVLEFDQPHHASDEIRRDGVHHGVELLRDVVVGIALAGDLSSISLTESIRLVTVVEVFRSG